MNTLRTKRILGFTIIELMIVLIIVAILLALAYPSYLNYVRKANRGEAQQLLLNWSINLEIWRSNNPSYEDVPGSGNPGVPNPNNDHYDFTGVAGPVAYTLTATAKVGDDQENDKTKDKTTTCTLTLNQNGVKEPAACWE